MSNKMQLNGVDVKLVSIIKPHFNKMNAWLTSRIHIIYMRKH